MAGMIMIKMLLRILVVSFIIGEGRLVKMLVDERPCLPLELLHLLDGVATADIEGLWPSNDERFGLGELAAVLNRHRQDSRCILAVRDV